MTALMTVEEAEKRYDHGTYARYKLAGCRCYDCGWARSQRNRSVARIWHVRFARMTGNYVVRNSQTGEIVLRTPDKAVAIGDRDRRNAEDMEPDPKQQVPVRAARRHLRYLRENGVGVRSISVKTGISRSILQRYTNGQVRKLSREREGRILAVTLGDRLGQTLVPADRSWELLDCLLRAGYSRGYIARLLGSEHASSLQIKRVQVYKRTQDKIEEVHARAFIADPQVRRTCPHREEIK